MIAQTLVDELHMQLPTDIREYLNKRHISDEWIEALKIGYGEFHGMKWITFPIFNEQGECEYFKLKRPPDAPVGQSKSMFEPSGSEAMLYPMPYMTGATEILLCEGEPDACSLLTHGFTAVCGTAGCGTFKEEWLEHFPEGVKVVLAFDNDEPGQKASEKVRAMFEEKRPDVRLAKVDFSRCVGQWGKDITDFFMHPLCWPKEGTDCPAPICDTPEEDANIA